MPAWTPCLATAVADFIDRYDLHVPGALPVPILQVAREAGWHVHYTTDLWPALGIAVVEGAHRVMRIDESLSRRWQRYVIAHEIGHVLAGHARSPYSCRSPQPGSRRTRRERQADLVAAHLLIPEWLLNETQDPDEIARQCKVPKFLAELRLFGRRRTARAQRS